MKPFVFSQKRTASFDLRDAVYGKRSRTEAFPPSPSQSERRRQLSFNDYTVGWICALAIEMTAARAILDEQHMPLPRSQGDTNSYVFGSIQGHNVVIVCLPTGVYGKASAATVAACMHATFKSIDVYLLVGIGGGAPQLDRGYVIRLGDVVVGVPTSEHPAVIQYDHGKAESHNFQATGSLNKPKASLLSAVSNLRSFHDIAENGINGCVNGAIQKHSLDSKYHYPGADFDVLWELDCQHNSKKTPCSCIPSKQSSRPSRLDNTPRIFYGTIASGDQVIKNHWTRDQISRTYGILCFEMEAAGLMDTLQALVIRGICDYCDSYKTKQFQGYAALTAASYAKELLSIISPIPSDIYEDHHDNADVWGILPRIPRISDDEAQKQQRRQKIMDGLAFAQAESRRYQIKTAHARTCEWLLREPKYVEWANSVDNDDDNDYKLLWIRGKPGVGKSTAMRYLLEHTEAQGEQAGLTIYFFFNARGTSLEKSVLGAYRSLVFQLLTKLPGLQDLLDNLVGQDNLDNSIDFNVSQLQMVLEKAVARLDSDRLVCFVDALDECPEEQVRQMIQFFERLIVLSVKKHTDLRVLFSSRHYPNISTSLGTSMVLEQTDGHKGDLQRYIDDKLNIGTIKQAESIKAQLLQRSSGIFFWVALVIAILNKEYDKGKVHILSKRIAEMPQELDALFQDILIRDNACIPELILCINWLLFSERPLEPKELYFALLANEEDTDLEWDAGNVSRETIDKMILDYSKGLVESTCSTPAVVQFIHESVREFVQKPDSWANLFHGSVSITPAQAHEQLRSACYRQVQCAGKHLPDHWVGFQAWNGWESFLGPEEVELRARYPFLDYAAHYCAYHADKASSASTDPGRVKRSENADLKPPKGLGFDPKYMLDF